MRLVPIIGPRTTTQLDEYLAALDVSLSNEQFTRLANVSAVAPTEAEDLASSHACGGSEVEGG